MDYGDGVLPTGSLLLPMRPTETCGRTCCSAQAVTTGAEPQSGALSKPRQTRGSLRCGSTKVVKTMPIEIRGWREKESYWLARGCFSTHLQTVPSSGSVTGPANSNPSLLKMRAEAFRSGKV